ncbi:MAG: hypothetical protein AAF921_17285 [Cyanobacteria bacterium P01_D01_bin.44]
MERPSDEDKLISALKRHRDLKRWVIKELIAQEIQCRETYDNDEKGDIKILNPSEVQKVQRIIDDIHQHFNPQTIVIAQTTVGITDMPHIEIKTQYLYGQETTAIIEQGTVIGLVSANIISQPSQYKLKESGITFAENIPQSTFSPL